MYLIFALTSDWNVKSAILYVKSPDTEQQNIKVDKCTVPEKVDMYFMVYVGRLELSTWYLIVIHNLTLYWSNIKYLSEYMFFCVFKNKSASNPVLANITSCSNCINILYLLDFRFRCKIFFTIIGQNLKICIIKIYSLWSKAARLITITYLII